MKHYLFSTLYALFGLCYSASGQLEKTKYYSARDTQNLFCGSVMILDSSGYFFHEWGCEGSSYISFGRYQLKKNNKIGFHFLPLDSIQPIRKVIELNAADVKDSMITITFFDRYGNPLDYNFGVRLADTSNKVHEMWTGGDGEIQVNHFVFRNVSLIQLLSMYREVQGIPISDRSLHIYMNLPETFLLYPEIKIDKPRKLNLQVKQNGLYNTRSKALVYKAG